MKNKHLLAILLSLGLIFCLNHKVANAATWKKVNNNWCYEVNGSNLTGWHLIDGDFYHFNQQGVIETGWVKD